MDQGTPPLPGLFAGVKKVVVNDGTFVHVEKDYHIHGDVNTHVHSASSHSSTDEGGAENDATMMSATHSPIQIGRDQHVHGDYHVHYHYPYKSPGGTRNIRAEVTSIWSQKPHYHVYIEGELAFCTLFSPIYKSRGFPVYPSVEAVKRYALRLSAEIDAGMYSENLRLGRLPVWRFRDFDQYTLKPEYRRYVIDPYEIPPKRDLKVYAPLFNFDEYLEKERKHLYSLPCMHGAHGTPASDNDFSPRGALFSHLDHSGVK